MLRALRSAGLAFLLSALIPVLFATPGSAFEIKLGNVREKTLKWLMESRQLSRSAAEQLMARTAREQRKEVIDSWEIADGALADFVTIDATGPGKPKVKFEGCGMMFAPGSDYGKAFWRDVERMKGTPAYDNFLAAYREGLKRGFFVQKLSPEMAERLSAVGKGTAGEKPAAVTQERILIAAPRMPWWDDVAPGAASPHLTRYGIGHPLHIGWDGDNAHRAEKGLSIGGAWNAGNPTGLVNPTWSNTGQFGPHPEINRFYGTGTQFREHWFDFFFNTSNPNSVASFWRANSHGQLTVVGDRSNIAAWLESNHILNGARVGDTGNDYVPMPGTPVIRPSSQISTPGTVIIRASLNGTNFSVLYYTHGMGGGRNDRASYTFTFPAWDQGTPNTNPSYAFWIKPGTGTVTVDPYDDRHVTFTGVTFQYIDSVTDPADPTVEDASGGPPTDFAWVMNAPGAIWNSASTGYMPTGRGCGALANTTVPSGQVLQSRSTNRLLSLCYYTHDHLFDDAAPPGERPYQLQHPLTNGYADDIMGATDAVSEHRDRPIPYDHNVYDDTNYPTGGYFHLADGKNKGGHSSGGWMGAVYNILADNGVVPASYTRIGYIYPNGAGAPTGAHTFIPVGGGDFVVPETAGLGLVAHESGHCFGLTDLYDSDVYWNGAGAVPTHQITDAMGPYSVMANGGLRVDAWHKVALGWLNPVLLGTWLPRAPKDRPAAQIPEIEGNLQNPIVYAALPDLWANPAITGDAEFFLIENRNRNGANYFGDRSPRGLYVYHIDMRFPPGLGGPYGQGDFLPFGVIIEQADGLYQLQSGSPGSATPAEMAGDPFPGSLGIRSFTQLGTIDSGGVKRSAPTTRSYGVTNPSGDLIATTGYDTFFRADNISDPGAMMTADLWVQPHELIVTAKDVAPLEAEQGTLNVPILGLHLKNTSTPPDISTGDVVIREILIDESGSSKDDRDTTRAVAYEDVNGNGTVQPGTDVLLGVGVVNDQQANITGLSFRVAANSAERDLLICYDIANSAEPGLTVGAGVDFADPSIDPNYPRSAITCQIPGVIQERVRTGLAAPNNLGAQRFPIRTEAQPPLFEDKTVIIEAPDRLTVTPVSLSPAQVIQGTQNVAMLGLGLHVNRDEVVIQNIKIDSTGTSTRAGDVSAMLYDDVNRNGRVDAGEALIDSATFSLVGGVPTATFDDLANYTVTETADRALLVAYDFAFDATPDATVNVTLANVSYVTLFQTLPPPAPQDDVVFSTTPLICGNTRILVNNPPELVDSGGGTTNWFSPPSPPPGYRTTLYTWTAIYTDHENQPPTFLQVWIDGTPHDMTPVNPGDTDYTDGNEYRYQTTLAVGTHVYYMTTSDGKSTLRFPSTAPQTLDGPTIINPPPVLDFGPGLTAWVAPLNTPPPDGTPRTTFTWTARYRDAESEPPSPIQVWVDGVAHAMIPVDPTNTDYITGAIFEYSTTLAVGTHSYYLYCSDGSNNVRIPAAPPDFQRPVVNDPDFTLLDRSGGTAEWLLPPTDGSPLTLFTWQATYADPESIPPSYIQIVIDGTPYDMTQADPSDTDYSDGAVFRLQTQLPAGNHSFYITASDGNNVKRYPAAPDTYPHPVVSNDPPTLGFGPGLADWIDPTTGTPTTVFTWTAVYTDAQNDAPQPIQVVLDGVGQNMAPANPSDTNYTDGAVFTYSTSGLAVGDHSYYMYANDGLSSAREPVAPNTYPLVITNTPPVLSAASVTPPAGDATTTFTYRITFTDADGHLPAFVRIRCDGTGWVDMIDANPGDTNTIDGKIYRYATGFFEPGPHTAEFQANDGFVTVTFPATGVFTGPVIFSVSDGFFADDAYAVKVGPYEEGFPVFLQVTDIDKNVDVGRRDTIQVTLRVVTGGDQETVTLTETDVSTGIFRTPPAGVPTVGESGNSQNGVLNVIAGSAGNTLQLTYDDPVDPGDTPLSRQAQVTDTIAPAIVTAAELLVSTDTNGSTVTANWTAYVERDLGATPQQVDVSRYRVFYAAAPFDITTPPAGQPVRTVSAGTRTVQFPTGGPNGDMYVAVAVDDEVRNTRTNVKWNLVHTNDREAPILTSQAPASGETEVALDRAISFRVEDDGGAGVGANANPLDPDIEVRFQQLPADGAGWHNITADCVLSGTAASRRVDYTPPAGTLLWNQQVNIRVICRDLAGNSATYQYSFLTVRDPDPPAVDVTSLVPADGATNVPVDTNIGFDLTDALSGVDPASIRVTVNGTNVTSLLTLDGDRDRTTVLYAPDDEFGYGVTVDVTIDAADVAGNVMSTFAYSFSTIPDVDPPVIDSLFPPDQLSPTVPTNTTISFRVQDAVSGVETDEIELTVMGTPITLGPANIQELSPTAYLVTYDPPLFPFDTTVQCTASVTDGAHNEASRSWRFRTEPPPTYSITGRITRGAGATTASDGPSQLPGVGVAGVKVEIIKASTSQVVQTVQTAGTGVYQVFNLLGGNFIVKPSLSDFAFDPATRRVYIGAQDRNNDGQPDLDAAGVDFTATQKLYAIKGRVSEGGEGLGGVLITLTPAARLPVTTSATGEYTIADVPSGTYNVTPSRTNYTFNPTVRAAVVASADATDVNFTAQARTFTVSGTIADPRGNRLSGVEVRVEGGVGVAVTSMAGQYTLSGVKAGLRTIVASRDGFLFEPAPGVDVTDIDVQSNLTGINFLGYPVLKRRFGEGTHFIGLPAVPRNDDPEVVFQSSEIARYSPTSSPKRYFTTPGDRGASILKVQPGAGFFVHYGSPVDLAVAGIPVPTNQPYAFVIENDWTMAANPFPTALPFGNLVPAAPGTMAPYGYVMVRGSYQLVSDIAALGGRRWVDAWEGVWLLGRAASASITAMPPSGTSTRAVTEEAAARKVDQANWLLRIEARSAGSVDACNAVGLSAEGALAVPNPPPLPGAVDVVLQSNDGTPLAYDLRAQLGKSLSWTFDVVAPAANTDVQLALPDLAEVPENLTVTLTDVAAGKTLYARTMPAYVYNSGQGGARQFRLDLSPRQTSGLTLRPAGAQAGRQGATITYVVNQAAQLTARVLNIAGQPVRTLTRGDLVTAGANTLVWDLSSDAHTAVPNGRYLVEIEAGTPDGQHARAVQAVSVAR